MTREAPACHPHGFKEIGVLAQSLRVKFAFHDHYHDSLNYRGYENRHGFVAYGVGFMGITDMFGCMVRPGVIEETRAYWNAKADE